MGSPKGRIPIEMRTGNKTSIPVSYESRDDLYALMVDMGVFQTWKWDDFMQDLIKTKRDFITSRKLGESRQELTPEEKRALYVQLKKEFEENMAKEEKKKYYVDEVKRIKKEFEKVK